MRNVRVGGNSHQKCVELGVDILQLGLVVARKNRVSNWQTENKAHAHTSFVITCGAEGLGATTQGASGGQNG